MLCLIYFHSVFRSRSGTQRLKGILLNRVQFSEELLLERIFIILVYIVFIYILDHFQNGLQYFHIYIYRVLRYKYYILYTTFIKFPIHVCIDIYRYIVIIMDKLKNCHLYILYMVLLTTRTLCCVLHMNIFGVIWGISIRRVGCGYLLGCLLGVHICIYKKSTHIGLHLTFDSISSMRSNHKVFLYSICIIYMYKYIYYIIVFN